MNTAELIEADERCHRMAYWLRDWKPRKLTHSEMLQTGIEAGLTEAERPDYGQRAGDRVYDLGSDPGLQSDSVNLYDEVVHLAALADIITCAIRKPKTPVWLRPKPIDSWKPSCYLSPDEINLRRVVLVGSWSDDRHYSVCRSWQTLGPICFYEMEMQIVVVVLGNHRDDKYHSHWTKAVRHPQNKKLRFRKKNDVGTGFKESWKPVWREEHDEITTGEWLQGMIEDDVIRDVCFSIKVPVPKKEYREQIIDLARRRMMEIETQEMLPPMQLSTCDWPVVCPLRSPCHGGSQPSGKYGFVKINP
jgi:hypothetical protein